MTAAGGAGSIATTATTSSAGRAPCTAATVLDPRSRAAMVADIARTAKLQAGASRTASASRSVVVDGHPTLGHSGRFLGARAVVRWLPREQIAIAVLTNQSRTDPTSILADLLKFAAHSRSPTAYLRGHPLTRAAWPMTGRPRRGPTSSPTGRVR